MIAPDLVNLSGLMDTAKCFAFATQGKPAYVYRFTRTAPGSDPVKVGAFHSSKLAYVFGTQNSIERL